MKQLGGTRTHAAGATRNHRRLEGAEPAAGAEHKQSGGSGGGGGGHY